MIHKIILILIIFSLSILKTSAQKSYAEPSEFAQIFQRPLVVELLEENEKIVTHLEKLSKKHPEAVGDYKTFVKYYNENIKMAVDKFWTLNKTIEYKTSSEIKALVESKNTTYACIYYSESSEQFIDYKTHANLIIPMLNYSRIEHHNKKVDYSIYLPVSFLRPHDDYIETDLIFGIQFMQRNIEYMIEKNKKISGTAYAKMFGTSCTLLETKTLLLDNSLMTDSISVNEIKDNYKYKFSFVPPQKINAAVEGANEENAYLVAMPYELPAAGGPGAATQIVCIRLVIDSKNGSILSSMGTSVRENNSKIFLTKDFAVCETCK